MIGKSLPIVAAAVAASCAAFAGGDPPSRNVVIIGWDGCERSRLHEMIARGEVPNLRRLAGRGALVDITVTTGATETRAGWAQILTGYRPEVTGVFSNRAYGPIPPGLSIFERVKALAGGEPVYTGLIAAKGRHVDSEPPLVIPWHEWLRGANGERCGSASPTECLARAGGSVIEEGGRRLAFLPGKPYFFTQYGMDCFANGLGTGRAVAGLAIATIQAQAGSRFLLFVQFARPDRDGHEFGENSRQYDDGIREDDCWTGAIVDALEDLGLLGSTLVYVVGDHGFNPGKTDHTNAPNGFCATNDRLVVRSGDRADIAPTVLKRMGVDIATLRPPLDGVPLDEPRAGAAPPPASGQGPSGG